MPLRRCLVLILWTLTSLWAIVGFTRYALRQIPLSEAVAGSIAACLLVVLSLAVAPRPRRRRPPKAT